MSQHLSWSLFGRHLQWVATEADTRADPYGVGVRVGEAAAAAGFDFADLPVRHGGLVEPLAAPTHLGPMVAGVRSAGVACNRITTAITPPIHANDSTWWHDQHVERIIRTAGDLGIENCRIGTTSFDNDSFGDAMTRQLAGMRVNAARLASIGDETGVTFVYHTWNRPGRLDISTAIWDIVTVFRDLGPRIGLNFDIGHIVSDGPQSLWKINMRYAMPYIRSLSLIDVKWILDEATGQWRVTYPRSGDGMVPWTEFFALALQGGFSGQASLQIEFMDTGEHGTPLNLNHAFWADHPDFISGNATRAHMLAVFRQQLSFYKQHAAAAGWPTAIERVKS